MRIRVIAVGPLLFAGAALAQSVPATLPSTPATATQPAGLSQSLKASPELPVADGRVIVVPFEQLAGGAYPWIRVGLQQDIAAELSSATQAHVEAGRESSNASTTGDSPATHIVRGRLQIVGESAVVRGELLDARTQKVISTFTATGAIGNLFPVEEAVARQIAQHLPEGWSTHPLMLTANVPQTQSAAAAPAPAYYSYTYPDSAAAPEYASPFYPYGYEWPYYGPFWFGGGFGYYGYFRHGGYGGHHHDGDGFSHAGSHGQAGAHFGGGGFGGGAHGGGGHRYRAG